MASVVVDSIKCLEETTEVADSDRIYMIVFRGNTIPPFNSNVAVHAPSAWQDFDKGETQHGDRAIAQFVPGAVYVVMLVEQDDERDIKDPGAIGGWRTATDAKWKADMALGESPAEAAQNIIDLMQGLIHLPLLNDDPIGARHFSANAIPQAAITYSGHGGKYQVKFKVA